MNQLKIVFIDDEQDLVETYEDLFESDRYTIKTFSNPYDAIDFFKNNQSDLCFIDYRMPDLNGVQLRAKLPAGLKCILLTGELVAESVQGFIEVLKKPLKDDKFDDLVERLLSAD